MVTKTPRHNAKQTGSGFGSFSAKPVSAARIAERASASKARCSSQENSLSGRYDILRLRTGFHHAQLSALLDAVVKLVPKPVKVLRGGDQSAGDHQPQQNLCDGLEKWTAGSGNQYG